MDQTNLRIILAGLGILLLLGIYLWERLKRRKRELDETLKALEEGEEIDTISINPIEETAPVDVDVLDVEESLPKSQSEVEEPPQPVERAPKAAPKVGKLPEVIQVSVAAPPGRTFSGERLAEVFQELGLRYGEMNIFHAYQGGEIQFSVASLVKPGTFPIEAMDEFETRGLTLFLQPPLVSDPAEAFERMIATCHALAQRLGGSELDDRRQPLTAVKISLWRRQLKES
ncbi:MAG: cell division protein ZipA [Methylohalobius sp.]|nr:cell division protein ZipA [Methylohalobius sp.]